MEVDGPQVELYTLGVGEDVDVDELMLIASPLTQHVLVTKNVEAFELFSRSLHSGLTNHDLVLHSLLRHVVCAKCKISK